MQASGARRAHIAGAGWLLGALPFATLGWRLVTHPRGLGADPIETLLRHSGWWALALLVATLAITPLRRLVRRSELALLRRPLGLGAFLQATLHLGVYAGLDQGFAPDVLWEDLTKRPFIALGALAWLLLAPLALTSTQGWMRRLGRSWGRLHLLIHPAALCGLIHFYWSAREAKLQRYEPLLFAALCALCWALRRARKAPAAAAGLR